MQKTVKLTSLNEGDDFYYSGQKYRLSRFENHYLGIKNDLTLEQFKGSTEVEIDSVMVKIADIKTGESFSIGTPITYHKTDMKYFGECICVTNAYQVSLFRETDKVYPL